MTNDRYECFFTNYLKIFTEGMYTNGKLLNRITIILLAIVSSKKFFNIIFIKI